MVSLRNEKAHDRTGQSADDMEDNGQKRLCIIRKYQPSDMIRRHCRDRNDLYLIRVQRYLQCPHLRQMLVSTFIIAYFPMKVNLLKSFQQRKGSGFASFRDSA